jgi:hypothetical protein
MAMLFLTLMIREGFAIWQHLAVFKATIHPQGSGKTNHQAVRVCAIVETMIHF